jgi:hypothetical protein
MGYKINVILLNIKSFQKKMLKIEDETSREKLKMNFKNFSKAKNIYLITL